MKQALVLLLILISFISNAQDSLNFSLLEFKSIKEKEFLLYPRWNYERPCDIPEVWLDMYPALDTNYKDGVSLTMEEKNISQLDKTYGDTIEKYGKVRLGNYVAYITRYKCGNQPQYMYMTIYDQKEKEVLEFPLASFDYGESGSSCLLSAVKVDKKRKKIIILSCEEWEGWIFNQEEEYCTHKGSYLNIISIDMQTMKIVKKEFSDGERNCE